MGLIVAEISAIVLVLSVLAFFAWDDYKTGKIRKEEDRIAKEKEQAAND